MKVFGETVSKNDAWRMYCIYLIEWAKAHQESEYVGMSPVCFDEWTDNEFDNDEE